MKISRYHAHRNGSASSSKAGGTTTPHGTLRLGLLLLTCTALLAMMFPGISAATQAAQANPAGAVPTTMATTPMAYAAANNNTTTITTTTAATTSGNSTATGSDRGNPPVSPIPPGLPVGIGCYYYGAVEGWSSATCTSPAVASKLPRPVIGGSTNGVDGLSVIGTGKILTEGFVTDWFSTYSGEKDSSWGSDSFSIQTNTNMFTGNNGQTDWVQFTEQYSPQGISQDCVWNIDITTQSYAPTCVTTPPQPLSAKFGADVVGEVTSKVVCFPISIPPRSVCFLAYYLTSGYMTPSGTWAVTALDTYGLHSAWTQTSGTILGLGGGSEAIFTHPTKVGSAIGVYSAGLDSASIFNTVHPYGYWTDESNNLNYRSMSSTCYGDGYCDLMTEQGN
jgi:hypothetical protein